MNTTVNAGLRILASALLMACGQKEYDIHHALTEQATFQFADPELVISLIASEPDIISPVDMTWAPDGSLYVVEMTGYPVTENKGRIKKLTDHDGDGHYTLASIFVDDLNFPVSAMYYQKGLLVADAPDVFYFYDSDGDGVADQKEVFLTGFVEGNQQYRANSLQWGLDNWIYGANGRAGGTLNFGYDSTQVSIDSRDFRVHPHNQEIQAISGLSQFGLAIDNWGNRFISYNHRFARQVMLEEPHLLRNPALTTAAIFDTYQDEHDRRVWTLLKGTRRFNRDPIGYFTSLSGLTAYRGDLLGPEYNGSLFAGESVQAAVIRRHMQKDGAAFRAIDMEENAEFLVSTDEWFHPVNFSNGPDGALYMVDFYRKFVEHPEWANDENEGGIDWNLGENHGRIWRIARKGNELHRGRMSPNLDQADVATLVSQFEDGAGWRRDMAQQLLVHRQNQEAGEYLEKMLDSESALARNHTYWTLDGLGLLTPKHIARALNDESNEVVLQGIKLAEKHSLLSADLKEKLTALANSDEREVRFRAIMALGNEEGRSVRNSLIASARKYTDKWTQVAILSSVARWPLYFAQEGMLSETTRSRDCNENVDFFRQIGNLMAYSMDNNINSWTKTVIDGESKEDCAIWALVAGYMKTMDQLNKEAPTLNKRVFDYAIQNVQQYAESQIALLSTELLQYSTSESPRQQLLEVMANTDNIHLQVAGIEMFSNLNKRQYMDLLYEDISALSPAVRKQLIAGAQNSLEASGSLLNALDQQKVEVTEISEELRYALLNHEDTRVRERAETLLASSVDADRDAVVKSYLSSIKHQNVNLESGANIFTSNCSSCHSMNGKGGNLGPDLTNIGSRSDEVLLTSILDPSRMVSYELKLHVVTTKGGKVYSGTVSAETATSITIKQSTGQEHTILNENIKERNTIEQSIMPEGYERIIDEKAMADLIAYLRNPGSI